MIIDWSSCSGLLSVTVNDVVVNYNQSKWSCSGLLSATANDFLVMDFYQSWFVLVKLKMVVHLQ